MKKSVKKRGSEERGKQRRGRTERQTLLYHNSQSHTHICNIEKKTSRAQSTTLLSNTLRSGKEGRAHSPLTLIAIQLPSNCHPGCCPGAIQLLSKIRCHPASVQADSEPTAIQLPSKVHLAICSTANPCPSLPRFRRTGRHSGFGVILCLWAAYCTLARSGPPQCHCEP